MELNNSTSHLHAKQIIALLAPAEHPENICVSTPFQEEFQASLNGAPLHWGDLYLTHHTPRCQVLQRAQASGARECSSHPMKHQVHYANQVNEVHLSTPPSAPGRLEESSGRVVERLGAVMSPVRGLWMRRLQAAAQVTLVSRVCWVREARPVRAKSGEQRGADHTGTSEPAHCCAESAKNSLISGPCWNLGKSSCIPEMGWADQGQDLVLGRRWGRQNSDVGAPV